MSRDDDRNDRREGRGSSRSSSSSRPLEAFTVREIDRERSWWTKIGSAFKNRDGSLTIKLDALPVNGTIIVREPRDDDRGGRS